MKKPEAKTAGLKSTKISGQGNCANLTGPRIEPQTSSTDSVRVTTELTGQ